RQPAGRQLQRRDDRVELQQIGERVRRNAESVVGDALQEPFGGQAPQRLAYGGPADAECAADLLLTHELSRFERALEDMRAHGMVYLLCQCTSTNRGPVSQLHTVSCFLAPQPLQARSWWC